MRATRIFPGMYRDLATILFEESEFRLECRLVVLARSSDPMCRIGRLRLADR